MTESTRRRRVTSITLDHDTLVLAKIVAAKRGWRISRLMENAILLFCKGCEETTTQAIVREAERSAAHRDQQASIAARLCVKETPDA